MSAELMQIGEVATRVGLSLRTLRHWDDVGLVVPSARSAGGFRLYTEADAQRLEFVKTLKPLDFALDQIRELMTTIDAARAATASGAEDGARHSENNDEDVRARLALFRAAADSRIEVLRVQLNGLDALSRELSKLAAAGRRKIRDS